MSTVESVARENVARDNEWSDFVLQNVPALRAALAPGHRSSFRARTTRFLVAQRLAAVLRTTREIPFDNASRLVFFSDCHRGDRSDKDAFAPNEMLFLRTLDHYYHHGFTYIEVGDGDELWQNRRFRDILRSHWAVFDMLHRFDRQGRLHIITGNHDVPFRWQRTIHKDGILSEEGLILRHQKTGQRILVTHGHQADIVSDRLSPVSRLAVRYIWRYAQDWRITDLLRDLLHREVHLDGMSPEEISAKLLCTIEKRLMNWVDDSRQMMICGHTHRARVAAPGAPPYFNTGSFVTPGEATGLEIQGGEICLVRWTAHPFSGKARREVLAPPRRLTAYL